ncbi:MAG: hypothetical protein RBS37_13275 [Bacteroidales bacterium]|nr:hypothetical protein [Bacteroidales bacterium]
MNSFSFFLSAGVSIFPKVKPGLASLEHDNIISMQVVSKSIDKVLPGLRDMKSGVIIVMTEE